MNNPKIQSGPVAGKIYPTKPEEPICHAINDRERKEASLITHKRWIDNPPGTQDCHFLDIINDDIGPHGISINPQKQFDADAEWKYLEGMLAEKVNNDTAEKIKLAHQKVPFYSSKSRQIPRQFIPSNMIVLPENPCVQIWKIF
jgi:hypothetical protein